jgi:hypothetical protein
MFRWLRATSAASGLVPKASAVTPMRPPPLGGRQKSTTSISRRELMVGTAFDRQGRP